MSDLQIIDWPSVCWDDVRAYSRTRVADITDAVAERRWLIEGVLPASFWGFWGAAPKVGKTWLVAEAAVAIASGSPFLGRFPVRSPGPVTVYTAEDSDEEMKLRLRASAAARGVALAKLDVRVIAERVTIERTTGMLRLVKTIREDRPRALFIDPWIRVAPGAEKDSATAATILENLRHIQREYGVGVAVTHHVAKREKHVPVNGSSLRGTGDLHAWGSANLYLWNAAKGADCRFKRLGLEFRNHRAPDPHIIELSAGESGREDDQHLRYVEPADMPDFDLGTGIQNDNAFRGVVLDLLAVGPVGNADVQAQLRSRLGHGVQNERVVAEFKLLEREGAVEKVGRKWKLCPL